VRYFAGLHVKESGIPVARNPGFDSSRLDEALVDFLALCPVFTEALNCRAAGSFCSILMLHLVLSAEGATGF